MITFHSVTKTLGRGRHKLLVLDRIDWTILPRTKIVILAQKGAGKSTLLETLCGNSVPTSGWVERRAFVSPRSNLTRHALRTTTARHLIAQYSRLYQADLDALTGFVRRLTGFERELDLPVRLLSVQGKQMLSLALFYGLPFHFYLFENNVMVLPKGPLRDLVEAAFESRRAQAGMIFATSSVKAAAKFDDVDCKGGVLHRGNLMLYPTVDEAIAVHEYLAVHDPLPMRLSSLSHQVEFESTSE